MRRWLAWVRLNLRKIIDGMAEPSCERDIKEAALPIVAPLADPPVLKLNYGGAVSRYLAMLKRTNTQSRTRMVISGHVPVRLDDIANSRVP